ncbi:MAG: hypothetical protein R2706_16100 [Acidimicrobiales bacterium]
MLLLSFLEGVGFDPFFRGLLSVLVGVVVLIGGTYLIVATNTGTRLGFLLAGCGLFGWMALMGIFWTIYGIGWRGDPPTWGLVEIARDEAAVADDGLIEAENERVVELGYALQSYDISAGIESDDPDARQEEAYKNSQANQDKLADWRFLPSSNAIRGEAQSSADVYLAEEGVFAGTADYLPLAFGGYTTGGKPVLKDDPAWTDRVAHKLGSIFVHPIHSEELMAIQVQGVIDQPTLPGQAPPVATLDESAPVYTVILTRERGGPFPWLFGGLRFVPAMFAIFNGILFALFAWASHTRDKREMAIRAKAS